MELFTFNVALGVDPVLVVVVTIIETDDADVTELIIWDTVGTIVVVVGLDGCVGWVVGKIINDVDVAALTTNDVAVVVSEAVIDVELVVVELVVGELVVVAVADAATVDVEIIVEDDCIEEAKRHQTWAFAESAGSSFWMSGESLQIG